MKKQISLVMVVVMMLLPGNLFAQTLQSRLSGQIPGKVIDIVDLPDDLKKEISATTFGGMRAKLKDANFSKGLRQKQKTQLTKMAVITRVSNDIDLIKAFVLGSKEVLSIKELGKLEPEEINNVLGGNFQKSEDRDRANQLYREVQDHIEKQAEFRDSVKALIPDQQGILEQNDILTSQELRQELFAKDRPPWVNQLGQEGRRSLEHLSYLDLITQGQAGLMALGEQLKMNNQWITSIPDLRDIQNSSLFRALGYELETNEFLRMDETIDQLVHDFRAEKWEEKRSDCLRHPALCAASEEAPPPPSTKPCQTCDDMADRMSPVGYLQTLQAFIQRSFPTIFRPDDQGDPNQEDFEKRFAQSFMDLSTAQDTEHEQSYVKFTNHVLENLIAQRGNQRLPNRLPITLEDRIASHLVKDAIYQALQSSQDDEQGLLFSLFTKIRQEFGLTDEEIENLTQLEKLGNQKLKNDYEQQLVKDSNQFLSTQERTIQLLNIQGQNTSATLIGLPPIGRMPEKRARKAWDVPQQAKAWAMNQTTLFGLTKEGLILARSLLHDGSWRVIKSNAEGRDILMQVANDSTSAFAAAGSLLVVALENKLYWGKIPELLELGSITWKEIPHTHSFSQITSIAISVPSDSSESQLYVVDQHQHFWRAPLPLAPDTGLEFFNSVPSLSNNTDSFVLIVKTNGEGYAWNPDTKILQKLSRNFIPPPITRDPIQGALIPQTPNRDPTQGTFTPQSGQNGSGPGAFDSQTSQTGPTAGNDGVSNTQEASTPESWTLDQTVQSVFGVGSRLLVLKDESDFDLLQTTYNNLSWSTIAQIQANMKEGLAGKETDILWREWIADRTDILQDEFQVYLEEEVKLKKAKEFAANEYDACPQSNKPQCKSGNIEEVLEEFQSLAYRCLEGDTDEINGTKCPADIERIESIQKLMEKYAKSFPDFNQIDKDGQQESEEKFAKRKVQALKAKVNVIETLGTNLQYQEPSESFPLDTIEKTLLRDGDLLNTLKTKINKYVTVEITGETTIVRWDDPQLPYQHGESQPKWVLVEKKEDDVVLREVREEGNQFKIYPVTIKVNGEKSWGAMYEEQENELERKGFPNGVLNQQIHKLSGYMCEAEVQQSALNLQTLYTEIHQRTEKAWRPIMARVESEQLSKLRGLLVRALVDETVHTDQEPDTSSLWQMKLGINVGGKIQDKLFSHPVSNVTNIIPFKGASKKFPVFIENITIDKGIWQVCDKAQFLGNCQIFKEGQEIKDVPVFDGTINSGGRVFGSYKDLAKMAKEMSGNQQEENKKDTWFKHITSFRPVAAFGTDAPMPDTPKEHPAPISKFASAKELGKYLYLDLEMSEDVTTSELVFATQRLQSLVQSSQLGEDVVLAKTENFDEEEWKWMQHYAGWKARESVRLYPENYLFPSIRPNPTPNFETFAKNVSDNVGREVEKVLDDFVTDIERHAEIAVWDTVTMDDRMVAFGRFFDGRSREVFYSVHHEDGQWKGWQPIAEFPDYEWRPHTNRQEQFHLLYGPLTSVGQKIHLFTFQPSLVPVAGQEVWDLKYITLKFDGEGILRASGEWRRIEGVEAQPPGANPVALTVSNAQGRTLAGQGSGTINVWQVRPETHEMQVWELNVDPRKNKLSLEASRLVESNFYAGTTGLMADANGSHLIWKQETSIPAVKPAVSLESRWWGDGKKWGENKTWNARTPPIVSAEKQRYKTAPDLAQSTNGHYVLVWGTTQDSKSEVVVRGFDASGQQRFTKKIAKGHSPKVSMDKDGNFVVLWKNIGDDPAKDKIPLLFQTFNFSGKPIMSHPAYVYKLEENHIAGGGDVAMARDGRVVVNWVVLNTASDEILSKIDGPKIYIADFSIHETNENRAEPILVQNYPIFHGRDLEKFMPISTLAVNENQLVVAWQSDQDDNRHWNVCMSGYTLNGPNNLNEAFKTVAINKKKADQELLPSIGLAKDGKFVVAFEHRHNLDDVNQRDVLIRGFEFSELATLEDNNDNCNAQLDDDDSLKVEWFPQQIVHNQHSDDEDEDGFQFAPQVAMGGPPEDPHQFVVVFQDEPGSEEVDDEPGIKIRTFNGEGEPIEEAEQFLTASDGETHQYLPTVVLDPFLGMVVAWQAAVPTSRDTEKNGVDTVGQIMTKSFKPTFQVTNENAMETVKGHFLLENPTTTGNLPPFSNPDLVTYLLKEDNNQVFVGGNVQEYAGLQVTTTPLPLQVIHLPTLKFTSQKYFVEESSAILGVTTKTESKGDILTEKEDPFDVTYTFYRTAGNNEEIQVNRNIYSQPHWHRLNTSTARVDEVLIGDFDGDGISDVFSAWGGRWYVSYAGTSAWTEINNVETSFESLRIGNFIGDSRSDILAKDKVNKRWVVSNGGTGDWEPLRSADENRGVDDILLGDFDADGKTDFFSVWDNKWHVSYGGVLPWEVLNERTEISGTTIDRIKIGNLNPAPNGQSDVLWIGPGNDIHVSYGGTQEGKSLFSDIQWHFEIDKTVLGDIDGDGIDEIFGKHDHKPEWSMACSIEGVDSRARIIESGKGFDVGVAHVGNFLGNSAKELFLSFEGQWYSFKPHTCDGTTWLGATPDRKGTIEIGSFGNQMAVIQRDERKWPTAPFARPYELLTTIPLKTRGESYVPSDFQSSPRKLTLLPDDLRLPRQETLYKEVGSDDFVRVYLDEYFLHLPMLYGTELSQQGQFEQAQRWLNQVYNPLAPEGEPKTSRALEFPTHSPMEADQLNPFPRADRDKIRYLIATKLGHISNSVQWAHRLFVQDTRESVNRARGLYTLAQTILGLPSPVQVACGVQDSPGLLANRLGLPVPSRQLVQSMVTISQSPSKAIRKKINGLVNDPSCIPIQQAALGQVAREATTSTFSTVGPILKKEKGKKEDSRTFMERMKEDELCPDGRCIINEKESNRLPYIPSPYTAQCLLGNPQVEELEHTIESNLAKIRAGQNYVGMERRLPLRVDNIDPGSLLLQQAQNGEVDFGSLTLSGPPPRFRYQFLWDRAKYLADQAQQLQHSLLSTLEKKDAARYSLFRARQDLRVEVAQLSTQGLRVQEGRTGVEMAGAQVSRAGFQQRHFQQLINQGKNRYEKRLLGLQIGAAGLLGAEAGRAAIINGFGGVGKAFNNAPVLGGIFGGSTSSNFVSTANLLQSIATIQQTKANFKRQKQDWKFNRDLAAKDQQIAKIGVESAWNQLAILQQEYENSALRVRLAQDTVEFLGNQFTGVPLYEWMEGKLRELYREQLHMAIATARTAQHSLAFELQLPLNQIAVNYWDDERQQLIGADRLRQDLDKLNKIRVENLIRKKELEKTISLASLAPLAFEEFKQTGVLNFTTPLRLFQQDFPSHYFRMIRDVDVSVLALIPPNQGIHATLSNSGISRILKEAPLKDPTIIQRAPESIALSSFVNDNGLFELRPEQDPLLFPFQGGGVGDTQWELAMPTGANRFDYRTIADLFLTIRYTALEDRSLGQEVLRETFEQGPDGRVKTEQLRFISLRQEFPDMWYALNNPRFLADCHADPDKDKKPKVLKDFCKLKEDGASTTITKVQEWPYVQKADLSCEGPVPFNKGPKPYQVFFELGRDHFLPNEDTRRLKSVKLAVVKNEGRYEKDKDLRRVPSDWSLEYIPDSCVPNMFPAWPLHADSDNLAISAAQREVIGTEPYGKWVITLDPEGLTEKTGSSGSALADRYHWQDVDLSWLEDVVLLLEYEAKTDYD